MIVTVYPTRKVPAFRRAFDGGEPLDIQIRKLVGSHEKRSRGIRDEITEPRQLPALSALKESCIVELYSDSKYVIDALEKGWALGWRKKGWIKSDKKPALNPDLWAELLELCAKHEMHYHWVKGHADNEFNERCDRMAVKERDRFSV